MKKYIYNIMMVISCLLFTGCNDWLDVQLDNKVDDNKQFSTTQGFKEALAGIYSELSKQNMYGCYLTMEYIDLLAQYYSYTSVSNTYVYWKDFDYTNSGVKSVISGFWTRYYHNIGQANCILEWADKNRSVLSDADRNQIRGEALGLRAFMYFDLYRLFSPDVKRSPKADGIPYNKQFGVSLPPMYTADETVQLIINDLLEAEQCLANDPITETTPYLIRTTKEGAGDIIDAAAKDKADQYVARINLYGVKAMLARAYQARGEYTKAMAKAQEVIDCGKFRLLDFTSIDQSETSADILFSDEHIFALRNKDLGNYSRNLHYNITTSAGVTQLTALPFSNVATVYDSNNDDVRYAKWFNNGNFVKFTTDSTNVYPPKMPVIKLSEMYLLIAECSYAKNPEKALLYINSLRDHRIRNNRNWSSLTWTNILEEMKREYVGEGQLWYVYKRNNLDVPGNGYSGDHPASDALYVFPFPDNEIEDGYRQQRQ